MDWDWEAVCEAVTGRRRVSIEILWHELKELGFTNLPALPAAMGPENFGDYRAERCSQVAMAVLGRSEASEREVVARILAAKDKR
jgi:hypothetical protein